MFRRSLKTKSIARLFPISLAPVFLMFCEVYHSPKFNYSCLPLNSRVHPEYCTPHPSAQKIDGTFHSLPPVNNTDKVNRSIRQPKISKASHQRIQTGDDAGIGDSKLIFCMRRSCNRFDLILLKSYLLSIFDNQSKLIKRWE